MHGSSLRPSHGAPKHATAEPFWLRALLIGAAFLLIGLLIIVPLASVFLQALGWENGPKLFVDWMRGSVDPKRTAAFWNGPSRMIKLLWGDADTRHSIWLTFMVAPLAVLLNTIFGLAAAWAITRFRFRGRTLLITMLDAPFAVSPVVAGLMFVLLFGMQGYLGPTLREWHVKILFAYPALLIATTFVTMPFVARELIPLMESIGAEEELAAVSLGANPWQLFWRITLPNIKWGLLFGVIQCHARAIGEFGAVFVVSGHISGQTDTMPLRVEKLFQDMQNQASYAVASLLTLMALATLFGKYLLEIWIAAQMSKPSDEPTAAESGG